MTATQRQRSTTVVVMPPLAACPEATLVITRALLYNPPSPKSPPKVAEQWRIDVDQLVIAAINTLSPRWQSVHRSGGVPESSHALTRTPMMVMACTPAVAPACMTRVDRRPAASLDTADLRVEVDYHRSGEDSCITIERRCEGHRNLDDDYGSPVAAPAGHTMHSHSSPGAMGRCMALAPQLRMVVWSFKFWLHLPEKYDGSVNPTEFLQIYTTKKGMRPS
jgi:hypothetical protein